MTAAAAVRESLWQKVLATSYKDSELPTTDPKGLKLFGLFWPPFLWQTMRFQSDTMPPNHAKLIHAHGTVVKVAFKASSSKYTGIFNSGGIGLARLSLAQQALPYRPGLAVKVLVDNAPSLNFVAMFDREGQKNDTNFFSMPFSSKLPPPTTFPSAFLTGSFNFANTTLSLNPAEKPENGSIMPLLEPAQVTSSGTAVANPVVPYKIVFQPEATTRDLYAKINATYKDMRTALAQVPSGTTLYSMYLMEAPQDEVGEKIGTLVTESEMVASKFGDDDLFFKHMRTRKV